MRCGNLETLQGHHFIISSARSLRRRFDPRNGITLCFTCHKRRLHTEASFAVVCEVADAALKNGILTWTELREILDTPADSGDMTRAELTQVLEHLKSELETLKQQRGQENV